MFICSRDGAEARVDSVQALTLAMCNAKPSSPSFRPREARVGIHNHRTCTVEPSHFCDGGDYGFRARAHSASQTRVNALLGAPRNDKGRSDLGLPLPGQHDPATSNEPV